MTDGSRSRRTGRGFARLVLTMALMSSGCQWLPVARVAPQPAPSTPPGTALAPVALGAPLPELPEAPASRERLVTPSVEVVKTSSTTPILDESLARAEFLKALDAEAPAVIACDDPDTVIEPATAPPPPSPHGADALLATISAKAKTLRKDATRPIDPERPAAVLAPRDAWREDLAELRALARDRTSVPGGADGLWVLRSRVLDWVADPGGPEGAALWRSVLTALAATTGPEPSDDRARAAAVREALAALEGRAPLEISDLRLCRKVSGFGSFEPLDATACKAGQPVIVYCEMSGLRYEAAGESFRSRLSSQVEVLPGNGGEPVWTHMLGTADDLCRRRRRDYYVNYRLTLPDTLAPGPYRLRLIQHDELSRRSVTLAIPLTIQP